MHAMMASLKFHRRIEEMPSRAPSWGVDDPRLPQRD